MNLNVLRVKMRIAKYKLHLKSLSSNKHNSIHPSQRLGNRTMEDKNAWWNSFFSPFFRPLTNLTSPQARNKVIVLPQAKSLRVLGRRACTTRLAARSSDMTGNDDRSFHASCEGSDKRRRIRGYYIFSCWILHAKWDKGLILIKTILNNDFFSYLESFITDISCYNCRLCGR